jgi:hypothetical protein
VISNDPLSLTLPRFHEGSGDDGKELHEILPNQTAERHNGLGSLQLSRVPALSAVKLSNMRSSTSTSAFMHKGGGSCWSGTVKAWHPDRADREGDACDFRRTRVPGAAIDRETVDAYRETAVAIEIARTKSHCRISDYRKRSVDLASATVTS